MGILLRWLQAGDKLGMPHSRPMPSIGSRCHELRITDAGKIWRVIYRLDGDAIVIADVFKRRRNKRQRALLPTAVGAYGSMISWPGRNDHGREKNGSSSKRRAGRWARLPSS
jgi:hypothetical protein